MPDLEAQPSATQIMEADELANDFRDVLAIPAGKRVLFWMLTQCAIYQDAFCGEANNATNYTLGQQSSGRKVIAQMDAVDPRLYPQLLMDIADMKAMKQAAARAQAANQENDDDED